ncbi:hypothetical protein C8Q74DRAFT_589073 [Fomes fomentarius]|nr:hypothetical protein C8Q74DRAFT_589073 [Fomes fomentarius]
MRARLTAAHRSYIIFFLLPHSLLCLRFSLLIRTAFCAGVLVPLDDRIHVKRHSTAGAAPRHRCAHPVPTTLPLLMLSGYYRCFPLSCSAPCILVQPMPPCHPSLPATAPLLCSLRLPAPAPNPLLPPPSASSISSVGAGHSAYGWTMFLHSLAHPYGRVRTQSSCVVPNPSPLLSYVLVIIPSPRAPCLCPLSSSCCFTLRRAPCFPV